MCFRFTIIFGALLLATQCQTQEVETTDVSTDTNSSNVVIERSSHHHHHVEPSFKGFWRKKLAWKPRWVKTWQAKKVYVAVWKRMWGPIVVKEWVPVPKPPPGWVKHQPSAVVVKNRPY